MPTRRLAPNRNNLPGQLSTFVGRAREIAEVKTGLRDHRLLTLTGPGGCGKTRLALQAASQLLEEFEDGVWWAELAPLSDAAGVPQVLASVLEVREQPGRPLIDTLVDQSSRLHALVVLDNCEHLIGACAALADTLLKACPDLSMLATSRERLDIGGEAVFLVPPLSLPKPHAPGNPAGAHRMLPGYQQSEAMRLFMERATSVAPSFELTDANGRWIAEICGGLDGMPLAIELAAARVRSLSVQQIAEHLDDRFRLLTGGGRTAPPRHQSLAAALDWSYALLSESEQKVLRRLSVFAGGSVLAAAEAVCSSQGVIQADVLDTLSRLIDKSLVAVDKPDHQARYRLLETIRQYARLKLAEAGEEEAARDRHLSYYLQWLEKARPQLRGPEQSVWLDRFEAEHGNVRAALEWSRLTVQGAQAGLRLATAMGDFLRLRGHFTEGREQLLAALAQDTAQENSAARADALHRASVLAFHQSDYPAGRALGEQSLAISRRLGAAGRLQAANALEILAEVATETGDYSTAPQLYEEALRLYQEVGDSVGVADTLKMLGWGAMRLGKYEEAESRLQAGLVACRQSRDLRQIASALAGLGELAVRRGRYERGAEYLRESLDISQRSGEKWGTAIDLGTLGWAALLQGDFREMKRLLGESLALRLETGDRGGIAWCLEKLAAASSQASAFRPAAVDLGAASALRATVGSVIDPADRSTYESIRSRVRAQLGEEAFEAAWAEGRALTMEVAVDYALSELVAPAPQPGPVAGEEPGGLTRREREVAAWIARGKSNREIASAMTVTVKTVETYVTRMLDKLGFSSRVQIATWAIDNGLVEGSKNGPD